MTEHTEYYALGQCGDKTIPAASPEQARNEAEWLMRFNNFRGPYTIRARFVRDEPYEEEARPTEK